MAARASASIAAPGWGTALAALAVAGLVLAVALYPTYQSIVAVWARSETFAHGFLIPPIVALLIYRLRHRVASLIPRPSAAALPFVAALVAAWVLGALTDVDTVRQFAAVLLIPAVAWAVLGGAVVRELQFPLAYLLFAVPFGMFLVPPLMDLTADFTVGAVRASGVPVYREGLSFELPTGSWSVVEACSGVRYLIATLALGTLYAYLVYRSPVRRALFIAASIVVPIAANAVRAYGIVMIGHLSGMELAAGVDHLVYGWVFFGVVIFLMFWVGARWREDQGAAPRGGSGRSTVGARRAVGAAPGLWRVAASAALVVALVAAGPVYAQWMNQRDMGPVVGLGHGAPVPEGWRPVPESAAGERVWTPGYRDARAHRAGLVAPDAGSASAGGEAVQGEAVAGSGDDTRLGALEQDPAWVGLHIAYYREQHRYGSMVGWANTLAGRDREGWTQRAAGRAELAPAEEGGVPRPERFLLSHAERDLVVWRWYWVAGRLTTHPHEVKGRESVHRLLGGRDDAALLVLYADYDERPEAVESTMRRYAEAALPKVLESLAEVRER